MWYDSINLCMMQGDLLLRDLIWQIYIFLMEAHPLTNLLTYFSKFVRKSQVVLQFIAKPALEEPELWSGSTQWKSSISLLSISSAGFDLLVLARYLAPNNNSWSKAKSIILKTEGNGMTRTPKFFRNIKTKIDTSLTLDSKWAQMTRRSPFLEIKPRQDAF